MRTNRKLIGAALIVVAFAFTSAVSTASNTVAAGAGRLGYSNTVVTGGTVNAIGYTLDTAQPPLLTSVKINVTDLTPDAVVRVSLNAGSNYDNCVKGLDTTGEHDYDCTLTGVNATISANLLVNTYIVIT